MKPLDLPVKDPLAHLAVALGNLVLFKTVYPDFEHDPLFALAFQQLKEGIESLKLEAKHDNH